MIKEMFYLKNRIYIVINKERYIANNTKPNFIIYYIILLHII